MKIPYCYFLLGLLILGLLIFVLPQSVEAKPCTDGVNCYCDRVQGGELNDPKLLWCEDFEAATLHDDVNFGGGAPLWGPWYESDNRPGARGGNNYWTRTYGSASSSCVWHSPDPATPTVGNSCTFNACFAGEWRADNLWQANNVACLDVIRDGEFNDEIADLTEPTGAAGGGSGVFDGVQSLGERVGQGRRAGRIGTVNFAAVTELGLTMALAYPTNVHRSLITTKPWKHDEFDPSGSHWNLGLTGYSTGFAQFPYNGFIFHGTTKGGCEAALTAATLHVGQANCSGNALRMGAHPDQYVQATDFPLGTWGCHQAYISGMGTSNSTIKVWHDEVLVFHLSGYDGASALGPQYFTSYVFDNYANRNQGSIENMSTETTYRYQDNMHLRVGPPVSCGQIGFLNIISPPNVISPPTNLQVQ